MKFLADMGISPRTVAFLKELGYEAVHAHSLGIDKCAGNWGRIFNLAK